MNEADEKDINEILDEAEEKKNFPGDQPMYTHIDAYYKGFHSEFVIPVTNNFVPAGRVMTVIDGLIQKGFKPSWNEETNKVQIEPTKAEEVCPVHKKPFRDGKFGKFCATKLADGSWCKEKPRT